MNENSLLSTLKTRLQAAVWTGSANVVFPDGAVAITANVDLATEEALSRARVPGCLIQPTGGQSDPEHGEEPDLLRLTVLVRLIVMVSGDSRGENTIMGANRSAGTSRSEGAGLTQLQEQLFDSIGKLNALESYTIQFTQAGQTGILYGENGRAVAWRDLEFAAWINIT